MKFTTGKIRFASSMALALSVMVDRVNGAYVSYHEDGNVEGDITADSLVYYDPVYDSFYEGYENVDESDLVDCPPDNEGNGGGSNNGGGNGGGGGGGGGGTIPGSGKLLMTTDFNKATPSEILGNVFKAGNSAVINSNVRKTVRNGQSYLEMPFKKGSVGPNNLGSGLSAYVGPTTGGLFGDDVTLTYDVMFQPGFQFQLGGKLHGLYGGQVGLPCSGGKSEGNCYSVRLMWRAEGDGELYVYLPNHESQKSYYCPNPKICTMGISLGRGSFKFIAGKQHRIQLRVKMNTSSQRNGIMQLSVDGKQVVSREDMMFRTNAQVQTSALFFCAFFGGSGGQWSSPIDQSIFFNNFNIRQN